MAVLNVDIIVNDNGTLAIRKVSEEAKKAEQATNSLKKSASDVGSSFSSLSNTLKTAGFAFVAYEAVKLGKATIEAADNFKLMEARLSLVTNGTVELAAAQQSLFKIAQETRQSLTETTDLYSRLARSTSNLGKSQKETLDVVESINKAIIISGSSASSAQAALMQLGQGFASGTLRGEELNSVLEQTPRLAEAIAKGMGKTVGELRQLGADGKLTAEQVFEAIQKQGKAINGEFAKMPLTIGQSMQLIGNSFSSVVGQADKISGASSDLAQSFKDVSTLIKDNSLEISYFGQVTTGVFSMIGNSIQLIFKGSRIAINETANFANEKIIKLLWSMRDLPNGIGDSFKQMALNLNADFNSIEEQTKNLRESAKKDALEYFAGYDKASMTLEEFIKKYKDLNKTIEASTQAGTKKTIKTQKETEDYEKALIKINDAINKNSLTAYEYGVSLIEKEVAEYQKAGISKAKIDEYVFNAKMELGIKQLEEETKQNEQREKEVKAQYEKEQDAMLGYYKAVGMESDAFYLEEVMKLQKLADAGILSNSQMLEIWAKDNEKFLDEQFKKNHEWLYDLFDNINKALDESFFDTMTGKFKSFGDWLKDFFSSIGSSIARGLSRTLAGSLTDSLQGGIVNSFKSYGLFGGASLVGSTLSASDMNSLISSGATASGGKITTSGGTIIDQASGMVTNQGSDAMSLLSTASSLKTAYGMITDGISGSILSGFNSAANLVGNFGFSGFGGAISNFGAGFASPLSFATQSPLAGLYGSGVAAEIPMSTMAGGMLSSGLIGYGMGSLGDAIFGAKTKAGTLGAVGAAIGSIIPGIGTLLGGVIGSILGGFFGSTKQTGAGIDILGNASADSANGQYWQSYKKKSWFSSKSWTNVTGFGEAENQAIMQTIGIYDTLLSQLGEYNDLIVSGGRFSNLQEFLDTNVVKSFLTAINPQNLDEIYQSWVDYAKEIDSTITEALASAVSGFTTYKRGYTEWFLGSGTTEQLEFTANYLQKDFEALASSLGASSVTVDNFLSMYDEAIKSNFTQDTITLWASLGDALMKATDANKKYKDSLTSLNATLYPQDMMLNKGTDGTKVFQQIANDNATMKLMYAQMLKTMKDLLTLEQYRLPA